MDHRLSFAHQHRGKNMYLKIATTALLALLVIANANPQTIIHQKDFTISHGEISNLQKTIWK
jgi:hypothetical protein